MNAFRLAGILVLALLHGCATVAFDYPRQDSHAISADTETRLKQVVDQWRADHPGPSGFYPLIEGQSALGARLWLIDKADRTIDAQYFLMKGDTAGQVFAGSLLEAADRGVRVRFLLDDVFTTVADEELALLDAHPNVEVRLYNPVSRRGLGALNFLADFRRANRRMHNKSFTVDNQATIVGGRNIADEYFELRPEGEFLDLDVIGIGPVAARVSEVFDSFWNDRRTVPMAAVSSRFSPAQLEVARTEVSDRLATVTDSVYREATQTRLIEDLVDGRRELYSAGAEVITDDPGKLVRRVAEDEQILVNRLVEATDEARREVFVITPYLVPGDAGVEFWRSVVDRGVRVIILTNSLASNNHTAVHAGYARYRKALLEAGVELYEARANAVSRDVSGALADRLTLHTKAVLFDRRDVFIGSLNLDPRSIDINSEMGLLVHSAEMGAVLTDQAHRRLGEMAWRVGLDAHGDLRWHAVVDGVEVVETSEPIASGWMKFKAFLLRIVPESQL